MKEIALSNGGVARVSDKDYARARRFTWWFSQGYVVRALPRNGKKNSPLQQLHVFVKGVRAGYEIDHRNGSGTDCRRSNLRWVSHQQNMFNSKKWSKPTLSVFKGVSWHGIRRKWRAYIRHAGRQIHLGLHLKETDAARAYNAAASKLFGACARLNFVV